MLRIKKSSKTPNPYNGTKWYLQKIKEDLVSVKKLETMFKSNGYSFTDEFIKRQTTDIIHDCIRRVQSLYCWDKNNYFGIVYREECFNTLVNTNIQNVDPKKYLEKTVKNPSTVEHVIPVSCFKKDLFKLNKNGKLTDNDIVKAFLSPVALINKKHTNINNPNKIKDSEYDLTYPFKRYNIANIQIFTHDGTAVDNNSWTMDDHWELLKGITKFKIIIDEFGICTCFYLKI